MMLIGFLYILYKIIFVSSSIVCTSCLLCFSPNCMGKELDVELLGVTTLLLPCLSWNLPLAEDLACMALSISVISTISWVSTIIVE